MVATLVIFFKVQTRFAHTALALGYRFFCSASVVKQIYPEKANNSSVDLVFIKVTHNLIVNLNIDISDILLFLMFTQHICGWDRVLF